MHNRRERSASLAQITVVAIRAIINRDLRSVLNITVESALRQILQTAVEFSYDIDVGRSLR